MDPQTAPASVSEYWAELLEDAEATAEEYGANNWETLVVHAGDVTPLSGEPFGLDVLAPGDEFEALETLAEAATFDTSHVYRTEEGDARFFIIVVEASDDGVAVVVPAFLALDRSGELRARATEAGVLYTHVRPPSDDARVTFSHEDPSLFF
jgi:hypothetical protein